MNIILIFFAFKYKGNWNKIYEALKSKEKVTLHELQQLEKRLEEEEINAITIIDLGYPDSLKKAFKPPFVIFYKGDVGIFKNKFLCLTGNWNDVVATKRMKQALIEINKGHHLVSSLWKGIDDQIYNAQNTSSQPMILISPNGLDKPYFSQQKNQEKHLIISEFPPKTNISKDRLRSRNRLMACIADSLILLNSEQGGKIMHLVSAFLNLGKEVFCYPGDGEVNDGNSDLIKQGANLITSIKDISN